MLTRDLFAIAKLLITGSFRHLTLECLTVSANVGTCESEISVRIESRIESGVVVYMFNADCHVGVVYLIMCKPTTLLHATLYVVFVFLSVL